MFRLLGPTELVAAGQPVGLGSAKQRTVLAVLLVDAGRPVSAATMVDRVWDEAPTPNAQRVLHTYVSRLRRVLEGAAAAEALGKGALVELVRRPAGYVLDVEPDLVDLHRFTRMLTAAGNLDSDAERAELLRRALQLWRGTPLADLPGQWATRTRDSYTQHHLDAVMMWAQAQLRLGRPREVISPVRQLMDDHPLTEPLAAVLLQALAAAGREAEALQAFAAVRARLINELGTEPGQQLKSVHEALLRGQPLPDPTPRQPKIPAAAPGPARPPAPAATPPVVPAHLPADVPGFAGRAEHLARLDTLLATAATAAPTAALITAVSGTAGVGKTALAVHWAHQVADRFPDGQLYVNLRGYDPDRPVASGEALDGFLRALGVPGRDIPHDLAQRAARYRTMLSRRRVLIVLDNASGVEQVRPLLPGSASCLAVVTSRDALVGLVALHGAMRVNVDVLPAAEAIGLLRRLVDRAETDAAALAALAQRCAYLPLALRVAAELANSRTTTPLAELVEQLADEQRRLDLLDAGGDPHGAIRAVFSWSSQRLPAESARAFRFLGLHPGPDHDEYAAAALLDTPRAQARRLLDALLRAHLIDLVDADRYGMHDLLRAYAAGLVGALDQEADRRAAIGRLFDHYLATAAAAVDLVHPAGRQRRPRAPVPATPVPALADRRSALVWLDAQRANLVDMAGLAVGEGWSTRVSDLGRTLYRYLEAGGHDSEALTIHGHAYRATRLAGDVAGQAHAMIGSGSVHFRHGDYRQAAEDFRLARGLYQTLGDRPGEAHVLMNLGIVAWRQGDCRSASGQLQEARTAYRDIDDRVGEARALSNLGLVHEQTGDCPTAIEHHQQALALLQETDDRVSEAHTLTNLGSVLLRDGHRDQSAEHYRRALALFGQIGDRRGEADALNGLGEALAATGRPDEAGSRHAAALTLAVETGDRYEQARAHRGIGQVAQATGRYDQARGHWRHALDLFTELDVPDAADLRIRVALLDQP